MFSHVYSHRPVSPPQKIEDICSDARQEIVSEIRKNGVRAYCDDPQNILATIDGVKGTITAVNKQNDTYPIFSLCETLGLGYKRYDSTKSDAVFIAIANTNELYNQIPKLDENDYEYLTMTEEMGSFLGITDERDNCWPQKNPSLSKKSKKLNEMVDKEYTDEELMDMIIPSVSFKPTVGGLYRMRTFGKRIRHACERFDSHTDTFIGTKIMKHIVHPHFHRKNPFCTEPSIEYVKDYFDKQFTLHYE